MRLYVALPAEDNHSMKIQTTQADDVVVYDCES